MKSRLRVGRAIVKTEEEAALQLMIQVKRHAPDEGPPGNLGSTSTDFQESCKKSA